MNSLKLTLQTYRDNSAYFASIFSNIQDECVLLEVEIPEVKRRKISRRIDDNPEGHNHFEKKEDELRIHTLPILGISNFWS